MKSDKPAERFQEETALRQRNLVYPDTVRNEVAAYRRLLSGRELTRVQRVGTVIVGFIFAMLGVGVALSSFVLPRVAVDSSGSRIFGLVMIPLAVLMTGVGLVIAVLGFRLVKRAVWSV